MLHLKERREGGGMRAEKAEKRGIKKKEGGGGAARWRGAAQTASQRLES